MTYLQHTGSFTATDQFGQKHKLHTYVERISVATLDEPNAMADGIKQLKTDRNRNVNYLQKGKYQLVDNGLIVTSTDPGAP